jgi:WhiB family transcriptional regulator, redox-sensing transcriptional regulator
MAPMYRLGTAAVLDGPMAAEAKFVQVTEIGGPVRVAVVSSVAVSSVAVSPAAVSPAVLPEVTGVRTLPCADDPDLFFAESPDDVELAKSLCCDCPVRMICLAGAVERREPWGVWGGELFLRGEVVPRKRARGRPRKSEVAA